MGAVKERWLSFLGVMREGYSQCPVEQEGTENLVLLSSSYEKNIRNGLDLM